MKGLSTGRRHGEQLDEVMMERWRDDGVRIGEVYKLSAEGVSRICSNDRGRAQAGDLLLVIQHAGDCFFYHRLIDRDIEGVYRLREGDEIGAYALGLLHEEQPSPVERKLLVAGKSTKFSEKIDVTAAFEERKRRASGERDDMMEKALMRGGWRLRKWLKN